MLITLGYAAVAEKLTKEPKFIAKFPDYNDYIIHGFNSAIDHCATGKVDVDEERLAEHLYLFDMKAQDKQVFIRWKKMPEDWDSKQYYREKSKAIITALPGLMRYVK